MDKEQALEQSEGSETYSFSFDRHNLEASNKRRSNTCHAVFEILFRYHQPKSIIDLGCGIGGILGEAHSRGLKIKGVDGPWWADAEVQFPKEFHETHDLNNPYSCDERFDIAATIEVAEHLKPERSKSFVQDLCALSDYVLFSAAIPWQKGNGHINNRWQGVWAKMFAEEGYRCYDPFRRRLFAYGNVQPWYKSNLLLYVNEKTKVSDALAEHEIPPEAASYKTAEQHLNVIKAFRRRMGKVKTDE